MNHNCWLFPCLDKLHLMALLILFTILLGQTRFPAILLPSKPWPLHSYMPNVSSIFDIPKHQRKMSSTWNPMSQLSGEHSPFLWYTPKSEATWKEGNRGEETKRHYGLLREYPSKGVGSAQWYWGSWLEISSFHNFSLCFFFLHSGFTSPASECPIASKLFFSKIDMARISMSSLSFLTGMFRSWVERELWVLPEIRADERHHTDVCHYHSRERN